MDQDDKDPLPAQPELAKNMAVLMRGRSIAKLRHEMAERGIKIGTGAIVKAIKGEAGNRIGTLSKLAEFFDVTVDQMLQPNLGHDAEIHPEEPELIDLDEHPELTRIRKVKLRLQAGINGYAVDADDEDGLPIFFRADWMAQRGLKPYDLLALKVRGDSMEPSLHQGDMVVVNTADTTPKDGEVFAVNYEGEAVIKRLMRDGGEWWLVSDNADQRRFPRKRWVDGDSFIVGRVVHKQSERI